MEALNLVNTVTEDDASKDFNEKEILITSIDYKESTPDVPEKTSPHDDILKPVIRKLKLLKSPSSDASTDKRRVPRRVVLTRGQRLAVRRGRARALGGAATYTHPHPPWRDTEVASTCCQEFARDLATSARDTAAESSLGGAAAAALVSAKVFTAREARWLPGRLQCGAGAVTISTALGQSIVFNICSIDHVKVGKDACEAVKQSKGSFIQIRISKLSIYFIYLLELEHIMQVENNRRVAWVKSSSSGQDCLGLLLGTARDCAQLLLALDHSHKRAGGTRGLFLPGSLAPATAAQPELGAAVVRWLPASSRNMEFLGRFLYHLKTPQKEVKSLEAANLYIK